MWYSEMSLYGALLIVLQQRPNNLLRKSCMIFKNKTNMLFIQGDVNRLRQGIALNLAHSPAAKPQQNKSKTDIVHTAKSTSGKAKYHLQQAEMSIVAENSQNSTHGSAKKSTQQGQNNTELAVKVMTTREKTVTLQRNVTKLDQTLRLKDQRIQLLNARLAELQQQLKAQQQTHKQKH